MTKTVIALTSVRGRSGKDTLIEELRKAGHTVTRVAFGDTLKEACATELATPPYNTYADLLEYFHSDAKDSPMHSLSIRSLHRGAYREWLETQGPNSADWMDVARTPRWHLQMYGTEYRREFLKNPNVWLDAGLKEIEEAPEGIVVVTDMRQRNEYWALRKLNSKVLCSSYTARLQRLWFVPGVDDTGYHKTDLDLIGSNMDAVIMNEWGSPSGMVTQLEKQLGGL